MSTGPQGERGEKGEQGETGKKGADHVGGLALVILILVSGFSILAFGIHKANTAAAQAHKALCSIYVTELRAASDSMEYLRKHPKGAPSLGISAADIRRGIDARKLNARAANPKGCEVPPELQALAREVNTP